MSDETGAPDPGKPPPPPETPPPATTGHAPPIRNRRELAKVSLAALGVVYGDIGTSPLYAVKECFLPPHGVEVSHDNVLGVMSLFFWSMTLVVVVKYLSFIMRADNHGEGGILALLALVDPLGKGKDKGRPPGRGRNFLILCGLFGAALLYGDGMITPTISVLSAVEGIEVATHALEPYVVPVSLAILIALFLVQRRGTAGIGAVFGPAMLVWFTTLALGGIPWIVRHPEILGAVSPTYAIAFFLHHKIHGFLILGAVVLCLTGAEALYADMGHFGRRPIRVAWYVLVMPALLLNYFGQSALLLEKGAVANPFYGLYTGWTLYPMVVIATVAAVVASQALISGAFSLTQQAIQLGYWPRMTIVHTSGQAEGQIYVPEINTGLMLACVALAIGFRRSTNLAAAYGIAVTGTMTITSLLFYAVARQRWGWSRAKAGGLTVLFLILDLAFFGANVPKVLDGGGFPLAMALLIFTIMTTWKAGRRELGNYLAENTLPLDLFMDDVRRRKPVRVKGTAVFMTSNPEGAPAVLLHHFKHNKVLHEQVVLLSISTEHQPEVAPGDSVEVREVGEGFYQVLATYGFMQTPNVLEVLERCRDAGLQTKRDDISFYLGRETLLATGRSKMWGWRKRLFGFLSRNARPANAFFRIPPNRVVELGTQIEL